MTTVLLVINTAALLLILAALIAGVVKVKEIGLTWDEWRDMLRWFAKLPSTFDTAHTKLESDISDVGYDLLGEITYVRNDVGNIQNDVESIASSLEDLNEKLDTQTSNPATSPE